MNTMNVSLLLLISVVSVVSPVFNDDFGLESSVFNKLLEDEKKAGIKEDIFLKHMWKKIQDFFPNEAVIPAMEVDYKEYVAYDENHRPKAKSNGNPSSQGGTVNNGQEGQGNKEKDENEKSTLAGQSYSCQTEAKLFMKLGEHKNKTYTVVPGTKKARLEVEAELRIDKPISFDVVVKTYNAEKPFVPTKMKYLFKGSNKVRISMLIPDFSVQQKVIAECLVVVTGIKAVKFEEPDCAGSEVHDEYLTQNENVAKEIPMHYFRQMEQSGNFNEAITSGLIRAFDEKIKKAKLKGLFGERKLWICISDKFKKNEPILKKRFTYGENYRTYCGGIKK